MKDGNVEGVVVVVLLVLWWVWLWSWTCPKEKTGVEVDMMMTTGAASPEAEGGLDGLDKGRRSNVVLD